MQAGGIYGASPMRRRTSAVLFFVGSDVCFLVVLATLLPQIATLFIASIKQPTHQGLTSGGAVSRKSDNERL